VGDTFTMRILLFSTNGQNDHGVGLAVEGIPNEPTLAIDFYSPRFVPGFFLRGPPRRPRYEERWIGTAGRSGGWLPREPSGTPPTPPFASPDFAPSMEGVSGSR
jgi:hypothetical protein